MAEKHLGPAFEIHGGGLDLVFPHHENEIAQSRGAGREFARLWMHNGILNFGGEKMSKSLGNVITLRYALDEWGAETLLMLFLGAHWRKPMDYTDETLAAAKARADGFREVFRNPSEPGGSWDELVAALDDDFNTPEALAVMHEWRDHDLLQRVSRSSGSARSRIRRKRRRSWTSWRSGGRRRVLAGTSTRPTGCGTRSRRPAGKCGTSRATPVTASSRDRDRRPDHGRRAVREALRGRRQVLEVWPRSAPSTRSHGSKSHPRTRSRVMAERDLTERVGTRDHRRRRARRAVPVCGCLPARSGAEARSWSASTA